MRGHVDSYHWCLLKALHNADSCSLVNERGGLRLCYYTRECYAMDIVTCSFKVDSLIVKAGNKLQAFGMSSLQGKWHSRLAREEQ